VVYCGHGAAAAADDDDDDNSYLVSDGCLGATVGEESKYLETFAFVIFKQ